MNQKPRSLPSKFHPTPLTSGSNRLITCRTLDARQFRACTYAPPLAMRPRSLVLHQTKSIMGTIIGRSYDLSLDLPVVPVPASAGTHQTASRSIIIRLSLFKLQPTESTAWSFGSKSNLRGSFRQPGRRFDPPFPAGFMTRCPAIKAPGSHLQPGFPRQDSQLFLLVHAPALFSPDDPRHRNS